jgi:hypothetical protein
MRVTKFSGELVDYNQNKLVHSLKKSGANEAIVSEILNKIEPQLYDGISSKKIYKLAFQYLKNISNVHAARYNLKTAIIALGPAGFYFEKYIAKIHQLLGYATQINLILNGKCVTHETDALLLKNEIVTMVECKFHSSDHAKTDVKVPMYILSRFNDLRNIKHQIFNDFKEINKCLIVTNNKFTEDAITFGNCSGLEMLGWDYPKQNGIKDIIDKLRIYPITCLTTLTQLEKEKLLAVNIITIKDLLKEPQWLEKLEISPVRIRRILAEADKL